MKEKINAVIAFIKSQALSPQNNLVSDWQLDALISHEHKLIIYTNAKCASGTIKIWFLQILGVLPTDISIDDKVDNILGKSIHEYIKENYKLYNYPKNQEYKYINYSKAIIVRNPWRRVVSFYCDKILIKENHLKSLNMSSQENYDKNLSFREFVDVFSKIDHSHLESHLRSQIFGREHMNFNYILKVENINANLIEMSKHLGINAPPLKIAHRNATLYKNNMDESVYDKKPYAFESIPAYIYFYNVELIKTIGQKYAADIETFNYAFHD